MPCRRLVGEIGTRCLSRKKTTILHIEDLTVALLSQRAGAGQKASSAGGPASVEVVFYGGGALVEILAIDCRLERARPAARRRSGASGVPRRSL
jgi:hypothetical protein